MILEENRSEIAKSKEMIAKLTEDMINNYEFYVLTQEGGLSEQINICNITNTDRYKLIDCLKEIMVDIILEFEMHLKDDELDSMLDREIELITVEYLASKLNKQHKKIVLFNISKEYPESMEELSVRSTTYAYTILADMLFETIGGR